MPTYEFRCPKGHEFSRFYKTISGSQSQLPCPECNEIAERQLSGGAGLLFKGSGFYLTDYGKNAHRAGSSTSKTNDSNSGGDAKKAESPKSESAKSDTPKAESSKPKAESKPASSSKA